MPEKFPEHIVRKASKTILHAAEKKRKGLVETMTAEHATEMEELLKEKPIFWENKDTGPPRILLDEEIANAFPQEFLEHPTAWIESQPNIARGERKEDLPYGSSIKELLDEPYDISRVKEFLLTLPHGEEKTVVSKRLDPDDVEEVALARRAYEAGIPTPKVLGEIVDRGNAYAFFEKIEGINLSAALKRLSKQKRIQSSVTFNAIGTFRDEKELKHYVQEEFPSLSKETYERMRMEWKRVLPAIRIREAAVVLRYLGLRGADKELLNARLEYKECLQASDIPEAAALEILKRMGYADIGPFLQATTGALQSNDPQEFRAFDSKMESLVIEEKKRIDDFITATKAEVYQEIFGFDYLKEKQRLEDLCAQRGITHKDFAERNIIVPWDSKNNRPRKPRPTEAKLYVIDWETKRSSKPPNAHA